MWFRVDDSIFLQFPDVRIGVLAATELDNHGEVPEIARLLREAEAGLPPSLEGIPVTEHPRIAPWREAYRKAQEIVSAPTPAESFRRGVRYSIQDAVDKGLDNEQAVERLVTQICYRAADLAYLLDLDETILSHYSRELRQVSGADLDDVLTETS